MMPKYSVGTIVKTEPSYAEGGEIHIGIVVDVSNDRCQIKWFGSNVSHMYRVTDMDRFFKKV